MIDANRFIEQMIVEIDYYREKAPSNQDIELHMTWPLYQLVVAQASLMFSFSAMPMSIFGAPVKIVSDTGLKYWICFAGMIGDANDETRETHG